MKTWQFFLIATLLVVAGFLAAVKKVQVELPVYGKVPSFEFRAQTGKNFSSGELSNRVWVAGFIFTRCLGPCPMISSKMAELKKRLNYSPRFALVSFSVDPDYDTPERLAAYSEKFKSAGRPQWYFLTGAKEKIYELATKTFLQAAESDLSKENVQMQFMHGTRLSLVDDQGHVRGFYDVFDSKGLDQLERDIRSML